MKPDRKQVLEFLRQMAGKPLSTAEITQRLKLPPDQRAVLRRMLKQMAQDGEVIRIKGHRYGVPARMNLVVGRLRAHPDGYGFVTPEVEGQPDIFVGARQLKPAMDGDKVVVRIEQWAEGTGRGGRGREGKQVSGQVIRVLERAHTQVVGRYETSGRISYVVSSNPRITQDVIISHPDKLGARPGQIVVARLTGYPTPQRNPEGQIIEVLGDQNTPGVDVETVIRQYDLPLRFPEEVSREAKCVIPVVDPEEISRRLDLREGFIFTIDGETARDFDDAVSIEPLEGGGYRLGVHIADVSYYVPPDSVLDKEALARGTSVYLPDRALPMLPEELSNGICSLNPGVERLTVSAVMEFDSQGHRLNCRFAESVICSRYRLTYTLVRQLIQEPTPQQEAEYAELIPVLRQMHQLAQILRSGRMQRGSLDFDLPEPEIILDMDGITQGIIRRERNIAHQLIEEFMLAANVAVAGYMSRRNVPFIYRIHEEPDKIKLKEFADYIKSLGCKLSLKDASPAGLQKALAYFQGKPQEAMVSMVLLRSMKLARYTAHNAGHYALAAPDYTHFTSPIRRYPDLVVHRLLKEALRGEIKVIEPDEQSEALSRTASHCSFRERLAEDAERDIIDLKRAAFMRDRLGEEYAGSISGVTNFGLFVELDEMYVEGMIHISQLDDYYRYDPARQELIGEHTRRRFRLGDRVRIQVAAVNLERRHIDFKLLDRS